MKRFFAYALPVVCAAGCLLTVAGCSKPEDPTLTAAPPAPADAKPAAPAPNKDRSDSAPVGGAQTGGAPTTAPK